jgi:hypothetical protein
MTEITVTTSTSTAPFLTKSDSTNTAVQVGVSGDGASLEQSDDADEAIVNAVFAYIKAVRALGRTLVTASEIVESLGIPQKQVVAALTALKEKGVKLR